MVAVTHSAGGVSQQDHRAGGRTGAEDEERHQRGGDDVPLAGQQREERGGHLDRLRGATELVKRLRYPEGVVPAATKVAHPCDTGHQRQRGNRDTGQPQGPRAHRPPRAPPRGPRPGRRKGGARKHARPPIADTPGQEHAHERRHEQQRGICDPREAVGDPCGGAYRREPPSTVTPPSAAPAGEEQRRKRVGRHLRRLEQHRGHDRRRDQRCERGRQAPPREQDHASRGPDRRCRGSGAGQRGRAPRRHFHRTPHTPS